MTVLLTAEKLTSEILAPVPHRHSHLFHPLRPARSHRTQPQAARPAVSNRHTAILKTFQAFFDRRDVRPGCVVSLQTFGGYGANFNPPTPSFPTAFSIATESSWQVFEKSPHISGNLMHDAHIAVLMLEHGVSRICTRDTDCRRFPFLEPLDPLV